MTLNPNNRDSIDRYDIKPLPIEIVQIEMTLNPNNRSSKDRDDIKP